MKRGLREDECHCDLDCLCHHHANPDARASMLDNAAPLTAESIEKLRLRYVDYPDFQRILAALLAARQEADRVRDVHLRRHRRLAAALGLDDGYSVDATIDEAIRRAALAATPEEK